VPCELIGIDNSSAMITACEENLAQLPEKEGVEIQLRCADISEIDISNASLVVMHYTLQFIRPDRRLELLRKIAHGLKPGGVLILSEKLCFDDPQTDAALTRLYYDFKKHNGYSELEISQKRLRTC
jgi:tRNA (cmo5U34)-methyltransferase